MNGEPKVLSLRKKRELRHHGGRLGLKPHRAAQELGVTPRLLMEAIKRGEVKTISFGGTFIPHSEVARIRKLLEQGEQE